MAQTEAPLHSESCKSMACMLNKLVVISSKVAANIKQPVVLNGQPSSSEHLTGYRNNPQQQHTYQRLAAVLW